MQGNTQNIPIVNMYLAVLAYDTGATAINRPSIRGQFARNAWSNAPSQARSATLQSTRGENLLAPLLNFVALPALNLHVNILGGLVDLFLSRAARARARGTRAHVRNVPSSVLSESTVRNLESSCTGCTAVCFYYSKGCRSNLSKQLF
jgi:hypothetical protein